MLKQRLITAIILIPIFVLLILKLSPKYFGYMTIIFVLIGAWEWSSLMGIESKMKRIIYPILVSAFLPLSIFFPWQILWAGLAGWLLAFVLVLLYPRASKIWGNSIIWRGIMGIFVLLPTFFALNFIRHTAMFGANNGPYVLLFLFVLIWCADSGAYFAGKKFGKNKLAPQVSPGKTWQGLSGALLMTFIIAPALLLFLPHPRPSIWWVILLALVTVLFSVLGDLFESMLKRNVGLKDSGNLFPGHGGLLDRIDSLTAAAPIFALGSLLLLKNFH
jgi:phosphatidate cytidylyltransferase